MSGDLPRGPNISCVGQSFGICTKPRVAIIYHFFPHYRRAVVEALARSTRAEFEFIGDTEEYLRSVEPAALSSSVVFHRARARHLGGKWMWQWGATSWAARRRYDVVIFHAVPHWPCTWLGAILARALGKRVVFWGHGHLCPPSGLKGWLRRLFYSLPHAHLTYGRHARHHALQAGWLEGDVYAVYNSLDTALQRQIRDSVGDEEALQLRENLFGRRDIPVVSCPTRLIAVRGLGLLIDALAILQSSGERAALLLIGDGPERGLLMRRCAALGIPAHFEGACYDEWRIGRLLRSSSVTVAPGKVGLTALHSLAYGVPVVTHGDIREQMPEWETVIPGKTGALFEKGSALSLASTLRPWLTPGLPPAEIRQNCHMIIDRLWNPAMQRTIIEDAAIGIPASDLRRES